MKTPRVRIARVIAKRTQTGGLDKAEAKSIAAYLLAEGRVSELDSLLRDISQDWAENGYVEVRASSAHELSPRVKTDIEREARKIYPAAKRVEITEIRRPDIIGGVKLEFANSQLDMSVESDLNRFKNIAVNGKDM